MLHVFQSNRLEALVTILATQIKLPANTNVFLSDTIMVQSPGMSQWLKQQLAEQNGIVANIDFPLPSSFIWRLYQHLLPGVPAQSPFNKDRMTWKLYDILPKFLHLDEFQAVSQYLATTLPTTIKPSEQAEANLDSNGQLRRYRLCQKIADVFDNYLMYRQSWLDHWLAGHNDLNIDGGHDEIKGQQWQAILWRELVAATELQYQNIADESPLHRAQMHQMLMAKLQQVDDQTIKDILPPRLFVFGISTMATHQLQVLDALSQHIDVQILWLNPCCQYWGDILSEKTLARLNQSQTALATIMTEQKEQYYVVGNPLLASWGKIGRDYLDTLTNSDFNIRDVFIDSDPHSLLTDIQSDITNLQFRGQQQPLTPEQIRSDIGKRLLNPSDDSLLIHNCHSRYRELEVLKDKLLGWFEADASLLPKDVLVMMPNVDQYAPYIDAVFGTTNAEISDNKPSTKPSYIPYTIADRGGLAEEPLLHAFCQFLRLPESRFTVSELLDYLELPVLMQKFDISNQELELIKYWLQECHVRWAKNASHKAKWGLPEINLNTWIYGLQRMTLGYVLGKEEVWHSILAYQHIEGFDANTLAKLLDYFQFVCQSEKLLSENNTLQQWHDIIEQLLQAWVMDADLSLSEQIAVQKIRDSNQALLNYQLQQDFSGEVSFKIIQQYLQEQLNEGGVAQRFLAGSMNFCTLMPMRSVPFKIICVLGLNEGDYPRQVDPISFDLVGLNTPRKGDRSRKYDDRYLFLEALVSAREKLHLSYIGQSSKNNQSLMPSVILSELIDYCKQSHKLADNSDSDLNDDKLDQTQAQTDQKLQGVDQAEAIVDRLVIKHRLQPFDSSYFLDQSTALLPTPLYKPYDRTWYQLALTRNQQNDQNEDVAHVVVASEQNKQDSKQVFDQYMDHNNPVKTAEVDQNKAGSISLTNVNDPIDLESFLTFWRHPIRYYFRNNLDIKLELSEQFIDDNEVFEHDGLMQYQMVQKLTESELTLRAQAQSEHQRAQISQRELMSGALPNKNWGQLLLDKYQQTAATMLTTVDTLFGSPLQFKPLDVDLDISTAEQVKVSLQGHLSLYAPASADQQLHNVILRYGAIRAEDKLNLWLRHLIKCASGNSGISLLVDRDNKLAWFESINAEHAKTLLTPWIQHYVSHQHELLIWHVSLALLFAQGCMDGLSLHQIKQSLSQEFVPLFSGRNLANDDYVKQVIQGPSELPSSFESLSQQLCTPLLDALHSDTLHKGKNKILSAVGAGTGEIK